MTNKRAAFISHYCDIRSSKRVFAHDYCDSGVPFYRGKEIIEKFHGALKVSTELFISEDKFAELCAKLGAPLPGDLLLTSVGTLGIPYVVSPGERFYFKDGNLTWFHNFRGLDSTYLYYWLVSPTGKAELSKATIGSSQPAFTIVLLKELRIECPDLPAQRKIASILSAYDDLIENNTRRIAILEEMAQAIYREWFVNFRFPGHENVRLVDSPLGKIPEAWKCGTVADVCNKSSESMTPSKFPEEQFDHYSLPAFDVSVLPVMEAGCAIKSNKTIVTKDSVLISKLNPRIPRIWLPYPCDERRAISSTEFMVMRAKVGTSRAFLYSLFRSTDFHDRFAMCSGGTSTSHQRVKPPDFLNLPVVVPPVVLRERFRQVAEPFFELLQTKRIQTRNLRTTRDLLLPKLISGQLNVEKLDIELGATAEELQEITV